MFYGVRSNGREHGSVMTKPEIVSFMLDSLGYLSEQNLSELRILEPAAGEGVFVLEIINRLHSSAIKYGFDASKAILNNVRAVELDTIRVAELREEICSCLSNLQIKSASNIAEKIVVEGDFLTTELSSFDFVVGNPPYVRYEQIPATMKEHYRKTFPTFSGRGDIYLAFFEKSLNLLTHNGRMAFICSDRWMKNSYGQKLRNFITSNFSVPLIVDLNDIQAFEEKVDGYPAIIVIQREKAETRYRKIKDIRELGAGIRGARIELPHINMPWGFNANSAKQVRKELFSLESLGFRIGIGVATGADKIFIGKNLDVEKDALLPLVVSRDIRNGVLNWAGNYVINPFDTAGKPISLEHYPKLKKYLLSHKERLSNRHISKSNPEYWYRTIDVIHNNVVSEPKILLPDIKKRQRLVIDDGEYYPHHNIYFISGGRTKGELRLLAAILMSDFVLHQLEGVSTTMRGGYVRWQSQNLRRILVPSLEDMPPSVKFTLLDGYNRSDLAAINETLDAYLAEVRDVCRISTRIPLTIKVRA